MQALISNRKRQREAYWAVDSPLQRKQGSNRNSVSAILCSTSGSSLFAAATFPPNKPEELRIIDTFRLPFRHGDCNATIALVEKRVDSSAQDLSQRKGELEDMSNAPAALQPSTPSGVVPFPAVHYIEAARRHMVDANSLLTSSRSANAGQLYGFVAECGLKALLIACGVPPDANGEIPQKHRFRQHVPNLPDRIANEGHLIPDGSRANQYLTSLAHLEKFSDWLVDHRYWREAALPLTSVPVWKTAAEEILLMLDKAKEDGVVT
ncbi:hypothetical protein [Paraburkholderia tropica]|uniref:hypothetical protein n=1 Tax=Paraburkholderia tropica TaxID=92647 RepID=UPI002AB6E6E1|nr:hypothetical protein [Paraburkholderia tropica]